MIVSSHILVVVVKYLSIGLIILISYLFIYTAVTQQIDSIRIIFTDVHIRHLSTCYLIKRLFSSFLLVGNIFHALLKFFPFYSTRCNIALVFLHTIVNSWIQVSTTCVGYSAVDFTCWFICLLTLFADWICHCANGY